MTAAIRLLMACFWLIALVGAMVAMAVVCWPICAVLMVWAWITGGKR